MDYKGLVEKLKEMLPEKIPYGELVGAPWPYTNQGEMVYPDFEDYIIEQAATAIIDLLARAEAAEAEIGRLRNEHLKIQYKGEELTVQELCTRLKLAECRAVTTEHDKASLLQDKRSTDLYIRDKDSGRIHKVGDECHDALWVDVDGTVHYSNLQNGDGCADYSQIDPNAGYEFMPSDFGELMVCLSNC